MVKNRSRRNITGLIQIWGVKMKIMNTFYYEKSMTFFSVDNMTELVSITCFDWEDHYESVMEQETPEQQKQGIGMKMYVRTLTEIGNAHLNRKIEITARLLESMKTWGRKVNLYNNKPLKSRTLLWIKLVIN